MEKAESHKMEATKLMKVDGVSGWKEEKEDTTEQRLPDTPINHPARPLD